MQQYSIIAIIVGVASTGTERCGADPSPVTGGNLHQPIPEGTSTHGGWKTQNRKLIAAGLGVLGASGLAALGGLWATGRLRLPAR